MNNSWLQEGHHWDLHVEHVRSNNDAGRFTGGGKKFLLHTTEGGSVDSNTVLLAHRNTPQLLLGKEPSRVHWTLIQFLPFTLAGKTLQNDVGDGYQTNRANVVQMEIVGATSEIPSWTDNMYERLANVLTLVRHRFEFPLIARDFSNPRRMPDAEFVQYAGILGHVHAPDNDHTDPERLREGFLLDLMRNIPEGGYNL